MIIKTNNKIIEVKSLSVDKDELEFSINSSYNSKKERKSIHCIKADDHPIAHFINEEYANSKLNSIFEEVIRTGYYELDNILNINRKEIFNIVFKVQYEHVDCFKTISKAIYDPSKSKLLTHNTKNHRLEIYSSDVLILISGMFYNVTTENKIYNYTNDYFQSPVPPAPTTVMVNRIYRSF